MSILKKLCLGALVGAMALAPVSAKVVTGTQEDTNMKLKYPWSIRIIYCHKGL